MPNLFRIAIAVIFLSGAAWAQDTLPTPPQEEETQQEPPANPEQQEQDDSGSGGPEAEGAAGSAEGEAPVPDEEEESVLDDQTFEGEDEDFIPTEEIPLNEPIPFPSDI